MTARLDYNTLLIEMSELDHHVDLSILTLKYIYAVAPPEIFHMGGGATEHLRVPETN